MVVIDDGNGYRSMYAHFGKIVVHMGQHVQAGQLLGYEGMTRPRDRLPRPLRAVLAGRDRDVRDARRRGQADEGSAPRDRPHRPAQSSYRPDARGPARDGDAGGGRRPTVGRPGVRRTAPARGSRRPPGCRPRRSPPRRAAPRTGRTPCAAGTRVRASVRARASWIGMKPVRGSRTKAAKNSPASSRPELVVAVGEVVAAAQHPRPAMERRVGEPHVRVGGDERRAAAAGRAEVGLRELGAARERRALGLGPADDLLLLAERRAVPGLDDHPDPPDREVRAAREPAPAARALSPAAPRRARSTSAVSSAFTLAVPSLKPSRFRGVACAVEVDEVRPNPSCDQRMRAEPKAARVRLRTACIATCGSSAQAWTTRSPSERCGSRSSPGKWGSTTSPVGSRSARPNRSTGADRADEQRAPEADGDREAGRRQVHRLAGVVGRRVVRPAGRPVGPAGRPEVRRAAIVSSAAGGRRARRATSS